MPHTRLENKTFPLLRLPAEVRVMIYHYHLTSEKIPHRWHQFREFTTRWAPINLLYVNRTIYNEAFFHLYTKGEFVLDVTPDCIRGLATLHDMENINASVGLELFFNSPKTVGLIRHVALDLHWPTTEYANLKDQLCERHAFPTDKMFEQTMAKMGAMLSDLPALRTIDVLWLSITKRESRFIEAAPPRYKIPIWLRGLKHVRRKNEKVLIRMPLKGPISTEELEQDQEDRGELLNLLIEVKEDIQALRGFLEEGAYGPY